MNPINSKKSPIHENAGANITWDFGDSDISRSRRFLSNTCDTYIRASHIASSITGRLLKKIELRSRGELGVGSRIDME